MKDLILVIDTSSMTGLCAIADSSRKILAKKYVNAKSSHSEMMFVAVQDVLKQVGADIKDVGTIVYTAGPGSFTGLRIAYSAVKGFAMALNVKTHGVSTLKALLYNIKDESTYKCSLIQGTVGEVYAFMDGEANYPVQDVVDKLKKMKTKVTCVGSGALLYKEQLLSLGNVIVPEDEASHIVAPEGVLSLLDKENIDGINYLKASYAERKKEKR